MGERAEIEGKEEMEAGREEKRNEQDEKRRMGKQERKEGIWGLNTKSVTDVPSSGPPGTKTA